MLTNQPMVKTIGNTTYVVEYAIGRSAKETIFEKVERLLLHEMQSAAPLPDASKDEGDGSSSS